MITRAVGEIRPLLAAAGSPCPARPARRRTLAGVFADAAARGVELRLDGTEAQVRRRARASRAGACSCQARRSRTRKRPPSSPMGKAATVGRRVPPGRMDDQAGCGPRAPPTYSPSSPRSRPRSMPGTGAGEGLADQVQAPPLKPKKDATPEETAAHEAERHKQSSERVLRRARQRGAEAMANPSARPRTTRRLRRDFWPSPAWLRPRRRTVTLRQPTRQASTADREPRLRRYTLGLLARKDGHCPLCGDPLLTTEQPPQSPQQWERWWLQVTRKAIAASYLAHYRRPGPAGHGTTRLVHASRHRGLKTRQRKNPAQPTCTPQRIA